MRTTYIVGNWKMFKSPAEAGAFCKDLRTQLPKAPQGKVVGVCPTMLALGAAVAELKDGPVLVGAQAAHWEDTGAFTGLVSMSMIKEAGARMCLVGHSEQRQFFGETDATVKKRAEKALALKLLPIVCIGETLAEREAGRTEAVLERQIREGMQGLPLSTGREIVVAYEPVWAIGTGKTATPEMAQQAHAFCRKTLAAVFSAQVAGEIAIQYGGSVKPENAKELLGQPDIDGALIGGASLKLDSFLAIVNA